MKSPVRNLKAQAFQTIADGLKRRSLNKCGRWAKSCVEMGEPFAGPFTFTHHPWLEEMHDANTNEVVGMKSAQVGFTVAAMNRAFYIIDVKRQSVLYLLPSKVPDAMDFSSTRFDPALELSPYLAQLFSDVKNVATKRAGTASLYIRGANSRSGLKSIPVSTIFFDEYDEMPKNNIPLAMARVDGQKESEVWKISTPIHPNEGIHEQYLLSTQERFLFPCPGCSRRIELNQENLKVYTDDINDEEALNKSQIICLACQKVLAEGKCDFNAKVPYLTQGRWEVFGNPQAQARGFYLNQLYSSAKAGQPYMLARAYLLAQLSTPAMQEWYNSKLGLPHLADGAKLDPTQILAARGTHGRHDPFTYNGWLITMGVDVGSWLHCEICAWQINNLGADINISSKPIVLADLKVRHFEDLDKLMTDYQILQCVIDANPEGRKAVEFAKRFQGFVKLCYYGKDKSAKTIDKTKDLCDYKISVDRTSWMDLALGRFHRKDIYVPKDVSEEYIRHMCEPARLLRFDDTGNAVASYRNKNADHFAHARTYSEIALPFAASLQTGRDIAAFL